MRDRTFWVRSAGYSAVVAVLVAGYFLRKHWLPFFVKDKPAEAKKEIKEDEHASQIKLTPQAQTSMKLGVDAIVPEEGYWRKIHIPGMVVDRPGLSDRGVTAPVPGVIAEIDAAPGDTVEPGRRVFKIRATGDTLLKPQRELNRTMQEIAINDKERQRLLTIKETIQGTELIKVESQRTLLWSAEKAVREELRVLGLTVEQIDAAANGRFSNEVIIVAPVPPSEPGKEVVDDPSIATSKDGNFLYELKELRVHLGDQVQPGQTLALLSNHQILYVEGRGFKFEADLMEQAVRGQLKVDVEFAEPATGWDALKQEFRVRFLANAVDPESRTFAFYIPLTNQSRSYTLDGRTFLVWRFRPGQRARITMPVEKIVTSKDDEQVFVLPAAAVARDGPDSYVFRQNGNNFTRVPVLILHEERDVVVLANDGSIGGGQHIVRNGAAALNRAIKAQAGGGGGHEGHDHSH